MPRIAVTGAAGNVGQQALQAFEENNIMPIIHHEHDDLDSIVSTSLTPTRSPTLSPIKMCSYTSPPACRPLGLGFGPLGKAPIIVRGCRPE